LGNLSHFSFLGSFIPFPLPFGSGVKMILPVTIFSINYPKKKYRKRKKKRMKDRKKEEEEEEYSLTPSNTNEVAIFCECLVVD